jgi:uncharacterized membrane protein
MPLFARLCVYAAIAALAACAPLPGFGPLFGPDSGITVVLLGVIAVIIYWRERLRRRKATTDMADGEQTGGSPELRILRQRYAKGEIDRDHYLQMLNDLRR